MSTRGERIEAHAPDAWINGEWREIAGAGSVGYKRILRFQAVSTNKLRVRLLKSRACPVISGVSAHFFDDVMPEGN